MGALYLIEFPNGKCYVGITSKTAEQRLNVHWYIRRLRKHPFYAALAKVGRQGIKLRTLLIGSIEYLRDIEPKAIIAFKTKYPGGYNLTDGGEVPRGLTQISLEKMSAVHKGKAHHTKPHTPEARAKMSEAKKGKKLSDQHRENIRLALLGNQYLLGCVMPTEQRRNIGEANKGKKRSSEQRENIRIAAFAREKKRREARIVQP